MTVSALIRPTQPATLDDHTLEQMYAQARRTGCTDRRYVQPVIPIERPDGEGRRSSAEAGTDRMPDPAIWARRLVPAVLECLSGFRQAGQLSRMVTPLLRQRLARRSAIARRRGVRGVKAPQVLKVHICRPVDHAVEAAVVVRLDGRVRAVALRMEAVDDRWVMTSFTLG